MTALNLAMLFSELDRPTPAAAEGWVAAALSQAKALRQFDPHLYPETEDRIPAAEHLHDAWRAWVEDANAVLQELSTAHGFSSTGSVDDLRDEVLRATSILELTPRKMMQRWQQASKGVEIKIGDLRRELQLDNRR